MNAKLDTIFGKSPAIREITEKKPDPRQPASGGEIPLPLVGRKLKENVLDADQVCRILTTCKATNVRELKFAGLEVRFGQAEPERQDPAAKREDLGTPDVTPVAPASEIAERAKKVDQDTLETLELLAKEERMARLNLEDPAAYERMLAQGELEDGDSGDNDG